MTQFVELNFTEYSLDQNLMKIEPNYWTTVCVCCLDHRGPFVNISSCTHSEFLRGIHNDTLDMSEMAVCQICHRMLAKIYIFREQVEDSLRKLNTQAEYLTPNKKLYNLIPSTPITSIINITAANIKEEKINLLTESQVKTELNDDNTFNVFVNEDLFKSELNTVEIVNDLPLKLKKSKSKKNDLPLKSRESKCKKLVRKKRLDRRESKKKSSEPSFEEKYAGKINVIKLNNETVMEERERDRAKEEYLKNLFKCEECVRSFEFEPSLIEHREKKHTYTEGSYQCDICKCYWDSQHRLRNHKLCHFKRYECVKCGKRTRTQPAIIDHCYECQNDTKQPAVCVRVCAECGRADFKTDRSYRYHIEKHRGGKAQCPHCDKVLANKNGLKTHVLTIHMKSNLDYNYDCKLCDKTYKTKMGLHVHKQIHHPVTPTIDKPEFCAACDITFKNIKTLKLHLKWHSNHVSEDAKKYICAHCGEKFLRKPELAEHVNWKHLKSKEHYCKLCDKAFKSDKILRTHKAFVHEKKTLPKNKICDHCGKGFTTTHLLRGHLTVHTRERPHKCDICEATFGQSAALYNHRKLVHKIRPKKDAQS